MKCSKTARKLTVGIDGKFSIISPYGIENFPSIEILNHKYRKKFLNFPHVFSVSVFIMEIKSHRLG